MVVSLLVYRNHQGERFYRLSPTRGQTDTYQVEATSPVELDRWLADNGFALLAGGEGAAA